MNFNNIIGHKKNIRHLKKIIGNNRIPHALLFTGAQGVGKRMVAVAVASALNCKSLSADGACGKCPSCIKLKAGTHPFVRFIGSPKSEKKIEVDFGRGEKVLINNIIGVNEEDIRTITQKININQIKQIIRQSSLKPYGEARKVFIIDDIALSGREALNSLLKILEEPPKETFFILITSNEELLFPTIISRCQKIEFASLTDEDMEVFWQERLSPEVDVERKKELLEISSGSPDRLLKFLKLKNIYFSHTEPEVFFENVRKWFSGNLECIEKLKILLELEGAKFRNFPDDEGCRKIGIIMDTIENIKKNANAELAVSNMFIKIGTYDSC